MRGLETDHVISGPMRGLNKCMEDGHHTDHQKNKQRDRHVGSMTDPAQRAKSVKILPLTCQASCNTRPISLLLLPNCTLLNQGIFLSPTQANFGYFQREVKHLQNTVKTCGVQCTVFNE